MSNKVDRHSRFLDLSKEIYGEKFAELTIETNFLEIQVNSMMERVLDSRQQQILRLRFGLDDGQPRTRKEIGNIFGLSIERIRQIEIKSLCKLRVLARCKKHRKLGELLEQLNRGSKKEKLTNKYTVPEMCQDCTLYYGEGWRCPVQKEPGWLYEKYGTCWSKRTDPKVDKKIAVDIERYIERYKGITI